MLMRQRILATCDRPAQAASLGATAVASVPKGAVLHCDLAVDPARETELLDYFDKVFRPVAETFAGYRELRLLKLRTLIQGAAPPASGARYRFHLSYESEAQRQAWTSSPEHAALWPAIEDALLDKQYSVALYEEA